MLLLATAAAIEPHASGIGSHRALGLPPCPFFSLFHVPCACCGLTTALAEWMRFRWQHALSTHVLVVPLALWLTTEVVCGLARVGGLPAPAPRVWRVRHAVCVSLGLVWCARLLGALAAH